MPTRESGSMRVVVAADHAGFELKEQIAARLSDAGYEVLDVGTFSADPVDYPDVAAALAQEVVGGRAERGILICGSGAGAAIAANKVRGIRSSVAHDSYTAHQAVEHDDMNVLALGSRVIGPEAAWELAQTFLAAEFSGEDRHKRRLGKVLDLEDNFGA